MGIENEVKFEASTRDLQKLAAARILRRRDGQLPRHKYLVSTYFDTPKLLLRKNGVDFEQIIWPDEIHDFLRHQTWVWSFSAAGTFLDKHLK